MNVSIQRRFGDWSFSVWVRQSCFLHWLQSRRNKEHAQLLLLDDVLILKDQFCASRLIYENRSTVARCLTLISSNTSLLVIQVWQKFPWLKHMSLLNVCRSWQVLFAAPVYRQEVSACSWPDHRSGVWSQDDQHWGKTNQAADMGHGRLSAFSASICLLLCFYWLLLTHRPLLWLYPKRTYLI